MSAIFMSEPSKYQAEDADWLKIVRNRVESLRFGVVQIIVHEGTVTQIESTEKTRLGSQSQRTE